MDFSCSCTIVIAIATMAVYSFTDLMLAYDDPGYLSGDLVQTRVNVEAGARSPVVACRTT